jgi:hypothetical protein
MSALESHVECRIEVEDTIDGKDTPGYLAKEGDLSQPPTKPTTTHSLARFFDAHLFRDPKLLYVAIALIVLTLFVLSLCACATLWLRCGRRRRAKQLHKDSHHHHHRHHSHHSHHQGFKFFPTFGLFDAAAIENSRRKLKQLHDSHRGQHEFSCSCSGSSSADSCKNSTSGISCMSESSAVFHSGSSGRSSGGQTDDSRPEMGNWAF